MDQKGSKDKTVAETLKELADQERVDNSLGATVTRWQACVSGRARSSERQQVMQVLHTPPFFRSTQI